LALVEAFHRSIEKHRSIAIMMFVIHRGTSFVLILLRLHCLFRSCLSVLTILSHMSSSTVSMSMSVLIRQDGLDAI
jgi:type III secretory pathway component EscR